MDSDCKIVLNKCNIIFETIDQIDGLIIPREQLLSDLIYAEIKQNIPSLKKLLSSSMMTGLHNNAEKCQRWPLLNLVRQILNVYHFKMIPIRKSDGYTLDGIKKYKRFFQIEKKHVTN